MEPGEVRTGLCAECLCRVPLDSLGMTARHWTRVLRYRAGDTTDLYAAESGGERLYAYVGLRARSGFRRERQQCPGSVVTTLTWHPAPPGPKGGQRSWRV